MSSISIKKVSVEEQHEDFIKTIRQLKNENKTLSVENETLKKIIMKFTFQSAGTVNEILHFQKITDFWEHVDP